MTSPAVKWDSAVVVGVFDALHQGEEDSWFAHLAVNQLFDVFTINRLILQEDVFLCGFFHKTQSINSKM